MKTTTKLRAGIVTTFSVLLLISALAIANAILLLQTTDDREHLLTFLTCFLFGSAASAAGNAGITFPQKAMGSASLRYFRGALDRISNKLGRQDRGAFC